MTNRNNNIYRMYLLVQLVLQKFAAIWTGLSTMDNASTDFNSTVAKISNYLTIQKAIITGYVKTKKTLRKTMATNAVIACRKVRAFVAEKEDFTDGDKLKISFSMIMYGTEANAITYTQNILTIVSALPAGDKTKCGISASEVTDLENSLKDYKDFLAVPRSEIVERKLSTKELLFNFKLATAILKNRMDQGMANYQLTNPDFYTQYFDSRRIVDLQRHTVLEGNVTDENGNDLKKVKVTIVGKDKTTNETVEVFEEMTDKNGNYAKSEINPELDYDLTYELATYEVVTLKDVDIARGEHELVDVKLVKIPG